MLKRLVGVLLLVPVALALLVPSALAAEGGETHEREPLPSIEEIGSGTDTARDFMPDPYEEPPFFVYFYIALTILAVVLVSMLLFRYLQWQPRFARERRAKSRR